MTLQSALGIAADGLAAQSSRLQIHANNIANLDTPNYVRKIPVMAQNNTVSFDDVISQVRSGIIHTGLAYGPGGVTMAGVVKDPTPGRRLYKPGHPEADKDGYVTMSNVNPMADLADATLSSRAYEANLAVVGIVKTMANRALEIGRGQ